MSSIDNRIVKMTFDNSQFEKNANTSLSTIEKLKTSLNFSGAAKGLENIGASVKQVDMSPLESGVQKIADKFDAMGVVAFTVLQNITNGALDMGKKVVSALTIDPIKMGFEEYETQINAVQTILANTQDKLKEQGFGDQERLDLVNEKLDELNTYADKTIYNFTEMTRNIGTFTAAGVELDTATTAIQGIANLAAVSGSSSQQASTAMYQLSQALASGTVKLMDWNSVVNAGMGGAMFQDRLKETARAHGIAVDEMIEANGSFRESLQEGWITADILTETLEKFTAGSEGVTQAQLEQQKELWRSRGYSEKQIESLTSSMHVLTEAEEEQIRALWRERGYTEEQIDGIFELGQMSTDAATKVKTFSQLIDTTKEALQSGWTQSFEYIIGDFEQAKELWTEISDILNIYIGASADARNATLAEWSEGGGRLAIIDGIRNAFQALLSVITPIKEAFDEVFTGITAQQLINISNGFKDFTSTLILNEEQMNKLKNGFKGIFKVIQSVIKIITSPLQGAFKIISSLFSAFSPTGNVVLDIFSTFGDVLQTLGNTLDFVGSLLRNLFSGLGDVVYVVASYIKHFFEIISEHIDLSPITNFFGGFGDGFSSLNIHIGNAITAMNNFFSNLRNDVDSGEYKFFDFIIEKFQKLKDLIKEGFPNISEMFSSMGNNISEYFTMPDTAVTKPKNLYHHLVMIKEALESDFRNSDFFTSLNNGMETVKMHIDLVKDSIKSGIENGNFLESIGNAIENIKSKFEQITPIIKEKIDQIRGSLANLVKGTADEATKYEGLDLVGVLGIGGAIIGVKKLIDLFKKFKGGDKESGGIIDSLTEIKESVTDTFGEIQNTLKAGTLLSIALAIGVLAYSLKQVAEIPTENLLGGMGAITILVIEMKTVMSHLGGLDQAEVGKMIGTTASLVLFSFSIKELASAIKDVGDMSMESILKGLTVVTILIAEMVAVAKLLSKEKANLVSVGAGLIEFAAAITVLVAPVKMLGDMDQEALKQGMAAVVILIAALGGMASLVGVSGFGLSAGAGLMAMATALLMVYGAVVLFAGMDWDTFISGLEKMALVLAAMSTSAAITGISGFSLNAGVGLIAMAGALFLMYEAIKLYSGIDWDVFADGMTKVAIALTALSVAAFAIGNAGLSIDDGLAIMGVGAALFILSTAVTMLAGLPTLVVAASLAILLAALIGFGAVAIALAPAAPILMQFAIAIGVLAVSALVISGALMLIVVALGAFGAAIIGFLNTAAEMVDPLIEAFTNFINASADGIRNNQDTILDAIGNLLTAFGEMILNALSRIGEWFSTTVWPWIQENGPGIIQGFIDGVVSLAGGLAAGAGQLFDAFCQGMDAFWPWIQENGPAIVQGIIDGIVGFLTKFGETVGMLFNEFCKAMDKFWPWLEENGPKIVGDLISGITSALYKLGEIAGKIIDKIVEGIAAGLTFIIDAGANLVQGFIDGMLSGLGDVWTAACDLANSAWNAITGELDEHSPSRVTFGAGENFTKGFINGILSLKEQAKSESAKLASVVVGAFDSNISDDYEPTVSPVMDLSNIQNGINSANSMFKSLSDESISLNPMFSSIPDTYDINASINAEKDLNNQVMMSLGSGMDYSSILRGMQDIQADLAKYSEIISKLSIVMDTGTLVGQLTPGIDRQLGRNAMMAGRGVL